MTFDLETAIAQQLAQGTALEFGPLDRLQKAYGKYFDDPIGFVRDVLRPRHGIFPFQEKVLGDLAEKRHVTVRSGHGPGKTTTAAWCILWFLATHTPAKVPCTAPSVHQLMGALWPEISKWLKPSRLYDHLDWTKTQIQLRGNPEGHFAIARSAAKGESLGGFHATYLLYVIDEASGVDERIMEVVDGALSGLNTYIILISNPTRTSGRFFNSHHRDRALWSAIHVKDGDSPLVTDEYRDRMARQWGRESDIYRVRVLGEFPSGESDAFIPLELAEGGRFAQLEDSNEFPYVMGIDPAELGQDLTAFVIRRGDVVLEAWQKAKILQDEIVAEVKRATDRWPIADIKIDRTGYGSGPWQALMAAFPDIRIHGINFGEKPEKAEEYSTHGEELWGGIRDRLQAKRLDFSRLEPTIQDELIAQLSTRRFKPFGPRGLLKLEPKDSMRSRGVRSPDLADALALAFVDTQFYNTIFTGGERLAAQHDWGGIELGEERVTANQDW